MAMPPSDDSLERLRAAVERLAAEEAHEVLAEARADARARLRELLDDVLLDAMVERVQEALAAERRPSPPAGVDGGEVAWYVYGVAGAHDVPTMEGLAGVDPAHPVLTVMAGELAAVTSNVALAEFDEGQLRAHLADMHWVERVARAHEFVLDELCARTTVVPMRMCTVYRSEDGVREMLARDREAFERALDALAGKTEWGVKLLLDPDAQPPARASAHEDTQEWEAPGGGRGAAYLRRRRSERDQSERFGALVEQAAAEVHRRLRALATESLLSPPQRPEASGHRGEMLLNGVYLVADETLQEFHREAATLRTRFASAGLELVATGPWPPYHFLPDQIGAPW
jgi:Gas vesicle synthesis protein GvpL/GvpF